MIRELQRGLKAGNLYGIRAKEQGRGGQKVSDGLGHTVNLTGVRRNKGINAAPRGGSAPGVRPAGRTAALGKRSTCRGTKVT